MMISVNTTVMTTVKAHLQNNPASIIIRIWNFGCQASELCTMLACSSDSEQLRNATCC